MPGPTTYTRPRFAYLEHDVDSGASALLPPGGNLSWHLLPAGWTLQPEGVEALRGWKSLCDVLLPALRACSHLHNLIHRQRTSCSLVLLQSGVVVAGTTFRILHDREPPGGSLGSSSSSSASSSSARAAGDAVLEVLLMAVDQRPGVCGQGHGTRVVNSLKALLLRRAAELGGARPILLTQADLGEQALAFWSRQGLQEVEAARALVADLSAWHRTNLVYDYTVPMLLALEPSSWRCDERPSARAQAMDRYSEARYGDESAPRGECEGSGEEAEGEGAAARAEMRRCGAATGAARRMGRAAVNIAARGRGGRCCRASSAHDSLAPTARPSSTTCARSAIARPRPRPTRPRSVCCTLSAARSASPPLR